MPPFNIEWMDVAVYAEDSNAMPYTVSNLPLATLFRLPQCPRKLTPNSIIPRMYNERMRPTLAIWLPAYKRSTGNPRKLESGQDKSIVASFSENTRIVDLWICLISLDQPSMGTLNAISRYNTPNNFWIGLVVIQIRGRRVGLSLRAHNHMSLMKKGLWKPTKEAIWNL